MLSPDNQVLITSEVTFHTERAARLLLESYTAPAAVYRPSLYLDGNQWCALYGVNIQEGVCGFGDTPEAAMQAFNKAWVTPLPAARA